jgi:hypothetical protein
VPGVAASQGEADRAFSGSCGEADVGGDESTRQQFHPVVVQIRPVGPGNGKGGTG